MRGWARGAGGAWVGTPARPFRSTRATIAPTHPLYPPTHLLQPHTYTTRPDHPGTHPPTDSTHWASGWVERVRQSLSGVGGRGVAARAAAGSRQTGGRRVGSRQPSFRQPLTGRAAAGKTVSGLAAPVRAATVDLLHWSGTSVHQAEKLRPGATGSHFLGFSITRLMSDNAEWVKRTLFPKKSLSVDGKLFVLYRIRDLFFFMYYITI